MTIVHCQFYVTLRKARPSRTGWYGSTERHGIGLADSNFHTGTTKTWVHHSSPRTKNKSCAGSHEGERGFRVIVTNQATLLWKPFLLWTIWKSEVWKAICVRFLFQIDDDWWLRFRRCATSRSFVSVGTPSGRQSVKECQKRNTLENQKKITDQLESSRQFKLPADPAKKNRTKKHYREVSCFGSDRSQLVNS